MNEQHTKEPWRLAPASECAGAELKVTVDINDPNKDDMHQKFEADGKRFAWFRYGESTFSGWMKVEHITTVYECFSKYAELQSREGYLNKECVKLSHENSLLRDEVESWKAGYKQESGEAKQHKTERDTARARVAVLEGALERTKYMNDAIRSRMAELEKVLIEASRALENVAAYKYCAKDGAGRAETEAGMQKAFEQADRASNKARAAIQNNGVSHE